ncbi:condensin subunit ScpA [Peptostreptococcaceae bacterium pGA-8]|nr:condensin subunit ScpA [Peptostreptococcaceae bacterium pGA-8]
MSYKVKIDMFEGPFDLLVYLIENAQMSIYDIKIAEITGQYLEYVEELKTVDVETAMEFMVLAANLIEIKSKMILPRTTVEGSGEFIEDPRSQLVERILEYKKFKERAVLLEETFEEQLRVFEKPKEDISKYTDEPDEYLSLEISQFAAAFDEFIRKKQKVDEVRKHYTRIERERASIESRIAYISTRFKEAMSHGIRRLPMMDLVPDKQDRYDVVVTFVSALQMMRDKELDADQDGLYGQIVLEMQWEKNNEQ